MLVEKATKNRVSCREGKHLNTDFKSDSLCLLVLKKESNEAHVSNNIFVNNVYIIIDNNRDSTFVT